MAENFDQIREQIEREAQTNLRENQALSRLLLDMWKSARADFDKARTRGILSIIATVVACVSIAGCIILGLVVYQQSGEIEAIHRILDQGVLVDSSTTTSKMEITQDTGESGGNNIFQSGEHATYEEASAE